MNLKPRYLSKSRFKKALECPSKLFYTGKPEYEDQSQVDSFMESLAEGGYQVGELAKCYYAGGVDVTTLNYQEALKQTEKLLEQENVIIYEPAFLFENLFVRVDILVKKGNQIDLIEVKAKLFNDLGDFTNTKGAIASGWTAYLMDIAFQKYVLTHAHPEWQVSAALMLANKNTTCSIDGLNQAFPIIRDANDRIRINHQPLDNYGTQILTSANVDELVDSLWEAQYSISNENYSFNDYVTKLAIGYQEDEFLQDSVGAKCKGCEFRVAHADSNTKSGFNECWKAMANIDLNENHDPFVFELTGGRIGEYFNSGVTFLKDLPEDDFEAPSSGSLSSKNRRWLHVIKTKENDNSLHFEKERFLELKSMVNYPLNMIDFETSRVAIPFHAGMRPYEQIAFQFSHHLISKTGEIKHQTEWINTEKGQFPNFEFIRQLKKALETNEGTIFRYSHHENTVLREIHAQLYASHEADKVDLMAFIDHITQVTGGFTGERNMVDLCQWMKETYFDLATKGSSSLKLTLPSILNQSNGLQYKYSQPIYGKEIPSLSIGEMTLIQKNEINQVINPYKLLPPVFDEANDELWTKLENVAEGGSAMTAYAKMQFEEIPIWERERITSALLRYCELDTMAMVMLWEGLIDIAK